MREENAFNQQILVELEEVFKEFPGANILFLNEDPMNNMKYRFLQDPNFRGIIVFTRIGDMHNYHEFVNTLESDRNEYATTGKFKKFMIVISAHENDYDLENEYPGQIKFLRMPSLYSYYVDKIHSDREAQQIKIKKHFLSYNNRKVWHRMALFYAFSKFNLLHKSYFSYLGNTGTGQDDLDAYTQMREIMQVQTLSASRPFNGINVDELNRRVPYRIDGDEVSLKGDSWPGTWNCLRDHYETSFCSVVTETYVTSGFTRTHRKTITEDAFLTEKVFKPMVMKHPFLLYANYGSLEYLKTLGFETFSSIFDETYDLTNASNVRFELMFDEVLKIGNLELEDLERMREKIMPVLDHNYNHFYNQLPKMYETEIVRVTNELRQLMAEKLELLG